MRQHRDYFELECCIVEWAKEKGIFKGSSPLKQAQKTQEELLELKRALLDQAESKESKEEIKDALGDIMVTLLIQAEMQDLNLEECLDSAYEVIKKRKGKMVNGLFVKDKLH